jgi:hypothetical protein
MRNWFGAALVMMLAAHVGPVSAQVQPPQDRIDTALARARQVGIPLALLESKVAEGKAKGVPLDQLALAVERRLNSLERASDAMKEQDAIGAAELGAGAEALDAGVSAVVLQTIAETAPRERRAVAIAVLTHLVAQGQVPETALARVQDALARGPEALLNLPAQAGQRGAGAGPPAAAGAGRPATAGPPAAVPAPGGTTQAGRPGGAPAGAPGGRGRP